MKELTLEQVQDVNGGELLTLAAGAYAIAFFVGLVHELMN